jgi:transcriptional regulator GlxA family with amidase domain
VLLCAALAVSGAGKRLLQEALPRLVHIQGNNDEAGPGLASLLELIRDEVRQARPAAQLLLTRYTEILVLQVLRAAPPSPLPNWRAAATQPGLARALSAIHSRPSEVWSVEMLSKEAGMSRSAFADAFTRSVGEGPIRYLTRWRLALAKDRLESETSISVEAVAAQVGYANAAAFSTAFRREFGVAPGGLRRR